MLRILAKRVKNKNATIVISLHSGQQILKNVFGEQPWAELSSDGENGLIEFIVKDLLKYKRTNQF